MQASVIKSGCIQLFVSNVTDEVKWYAAQYAQILGMTAGGTGK